MAGWFCMIRGGHALGRGVPGPSSLAPSPLNQRARSLQVGPCQGSSSQQFWLLTGALRDMPSLPEAEANVSLAAPNSPPPPQFCCSCEAECPWQQVQTLPTSSQQQSLAFHMQINQWDWWGSSPPPSCVDFRPCSVPVWFPQPTYICHESLARL